METVSTTPKKVFKIILNSADTTSWSGILYNANYPVNMNNIIRDIEDYNKVYGLTFSLKGFEDGGIWDDSYYALRLNLGNKVIPILPTNNQIYSGSLFNNCYQGRTNKFWETRPIDNTPVYYRDIQNINNISFTIWDFQYNRVYVPETTGTVPKNYICVITLTEL